MENSKSKSKSKLNGQINVTQLSENVLIKSLETINKTLLRQEEQGTKSLLMCEEFKQKNDEDRDRMKRFMKDIHQWEDPTEVSNEAAPDKKKLLVEKQKSFSNGLECGFYIGFGVAILCVISTIWRD